MDLIRKIGKAEIRRFLHQRNINCHNGWLAWLKDNLKFKKKTPQQLVYKVRSISSEIDKSSHWYDSSTLRNICVIATFDRFLDNIHLISWKVLGRPKYLPLSNSWFWHFKRIFWRVGITWQIKILLLIFYFVNVKKRKRLSSLLSLALSICLLVAKQRWFANDWNTSDWNTSQSKLMVTFPINSMMIDVESTAYYLSWYLKPSRGSNVEEVTDIKG